jgi:hypothetical protein
MQLHLTLGDHAARLLEAACRDHGLAGMVMAIPEDPSHGPLDDGAARVAYMRACYHHCLEWTVPFSDAFAPWTDLLELLAHNPIDPVLIWHADSVSRYVFLRMACWWLRGYSGSLDLVEVPARDGAYGVALYPSAELAAFATQRRLRIEQEQRDQLTAEFGIIRTRPELLRRYEQNQLHFLPADYYDSLLLDACSPEWQPAAQVTGTVMRQCDGQNRMSDLFFCSRLQHLIETGRLEASGPRRCMQDHQVRTPEKGAIHD